MKLFDAIIEAQMTEMLIAELRKNLHQQGCLLPDRTQVVKTQRKKLARLESDIEAMLNK